MLQYGHCFCLLRTCKVSVPLLGSPIWIVYLSMLELSLLASSFIVLMRQEGGILAYEDFLDPCVGLF